jgi:hypothetical protein
MKSEHIPWILSNSVDDVNYNSHLKEMNAEEVEYCLRNEKRKTSILKLKARLRQLKKKPEEEQGYRLRTRHGYHEDWMDCARDGCGLYAPPKPWKKYRKKPVVVEAFRTEKELTIPTLEGDMKAGKGDYIVRGIEGELYPVKPGIFEKLYEPVEKGATP